MRFVLVMLLFLSYAYSQRLVIGPAEEIYPLGYLSSRENCSGCDDKNAEILPWYSDNAWPNEWMADGVVSHLKKDDGTLITFWPTPNRIQRWEGTLTDPRRDYREIEAVGTYHVFSMPVEMGNVFNGLGAYYLWKQPLIPLKTASVYLQNIYKEPSTNELIGFTHNEIFTLGYDAERKYSIGIAYSDDLGDTWSFLGEIIKPYDDKRGTDYNIHGAPYLVIDDWFYVYFREYAKSGVARAKIDDVLAAAQNGTVSAWQKYNNGVWTNGLTGEASNVIFLPPGWAHNTQSDAVHFTTLSHSPYILVVGAMNSAGKFAIFLLRSNDGLVWGAPITVAEYDGFDVFYPSILSIGEGADDGHTMSGSFYIYYPKKEYPHPNGGSPESYYSIVRHRVSVDITPIINSLLLD